jgi:predicted nucleic acid-binding protein
VTYVVDCSFSSTLFLPDENSLSTRDFFINISPKDTVFVPVLWWYETINVINVSIRRKRIISSEYNRILDLFKSLHFVTEYDINNDISRQIITLAQDYSLSGYDSVYLELAIRKKAKLMTFDKNLHCAFKAANK